jgi:hypothetical protein
MFQIAADYDRKARQAKAFEPQTSKTNKPLPAPPREKAATIMPLSQQQLGEPARRISYEDHARRKKTF